MKIWLVTLINQSEPEHKVYIVDAHSTKPKAKEHKQSLGSLSDFAQVVEMNVDGDQAPILVGVAPEGIMDSCKKNSPNSDS